ncbi:anaerobic ribonucleotide reductase-activating protein [compost metagenome]
MSWLNLAARVSCTEAEGPGRRAAIWVQGCDKRCPGCCNPGYLRIQPQDVVTASEVLEWLAMVQLRENIEGVTFLGGEPLLQAKGLALVASGAQMLGLSVMIFSGYTLAEIHELAPAGAEDLLASTDVLVDGAYDATQPETLRNWVGSRNQQFHYLSDRYDPQIEISGARLRTQEWRVTANGAVKVNGWPEPVRLVRP